MSAPGPYETDPFHPPALFTLYDNFNFCIYTVLFRVFLSCCTYCVLERYICHLRMRSFKIASVSRFRAILKSFCLLYAVRIGTRFSETMPLKLDTDASLYGILGVGQIPDNKFCGAS